MPTIAPSHVQPLLATDPLACVPLAPRWLSEPPAPPAALRVESFGQWLVTQRDRGDVVDRLASRARRDPSFPRHGTVVDVRRWLGAEAADRAALFQLAAAARCWLTL